MGVFPGRELFVEHWKQESLSPMDAHHPASSLNLAQLVTFYPCQCQWKPSSIRHMQPSFCQGNHQFKKQGKMRAGEFDLAYTLLAVLLPCPGSPAAPARGFLLSRNNYLKMLKFLATSGDTSRSQGIHCHTRFPIPLPEPVWLKLVWFCASFLPWKLQQCHPADTKREGNIERAAQA